MTRSPMGSGTIMSTMTSTHGTVLSSYKRNWSASGMGIINTEVQVGPQVEDPANRDVGVCSTT
jgi:hypothetical protein